jgi:hypothetical protein
MPVKYFVYKAPPSYNTSVPVWLSVRIYRDGLWHELRRYEYHAGYVEDTPLHLNPFARGSVLSVTVTAGGGAYVQATTIATIISGRAVGRFLPVLLIAMSSSRLSL